MTSTRTKISPPVVARRWGKKPATIIALIQSGDLPAIDVRTKGSSRPRYLIDLQDLAAFEARRAVVAPRTRSTRKRLPEENDPDFVRYF